MLTVSGRGGDPVGPGRVLVRVDHRYCWLTEPSSLLVGDAAKARQRLGWGTQVTIEELTSEMVRGDPQEARREDVRGEDLGVETYLR